MRLFMEIIAKSAERTKKIGEILAKEILKTGPAKKAVVLALAGELGSGKTNFVQGFARGLGIEEKITSPTFVLMKRFKIKDVRFKNFYHLDCYRIQKPKDILGLGLKEIINNPKNIVAMEWADKIRRALPKNAFWLKLKFVGKNTRKITISKLW